jgi:hypothetical protein
MVSLGKDTLDLVMLRAVHSPFMDPTNVHGTLLNVQCCVPLIRQWDQPRHLPEITGRGVAVANVQCDMIMCLIQKCYDFNQISSAIFFIYNQGQTGTKIQSWHFSHISMTHFNWSILTEWLTESQNSYHSLWWLHWWLTILDLVLCSKMWNCVF